MTLIARRLPVWVGISLMFSSIAQVNSAAAENKTGGEITDFGVLSKLANSIWGKRASTAYSWIIPGEILEEDIIFEDGKIQRTEYRRSIDGRSIIARIDGNTAISVVRFPSSDSWEVASSDGALYYRCRLVSAANLLMCERPDDKGGITPYEVPQSSEAIRAAMREKGEIMRANREVERASFIDGERKIWGAWADASLTFDASGGATWQPREYRVIAGKLDGETYEAIIRVGWTIEADGSLSMTESLVAPSLNFYGWWYWKQNRKTGIMQRHYTKKGFSRLRTH